MKTNSADWKPYVWLTPIGSQMTVRRKSSAMMMADALKIHANRRGDMRLDRIVMRRNTSATAHSMARNLTLVLSRPPGK